MNAAGLFARGYAWLGLAGGLAAMLAMAIPAFLYAGRTAERYSPFNHFVSELGEIGISRSASVFNAGLILSGLLLFPFVTGLGLAVPGLAAKAGMVFGWSASLACAAIGFYPMNRLKPHLLAAVVFFDCSLAAVFLFTLSYWLQPPGVELVPRGLAAVGLLSLAFQILFFFGGLRIPVGTDGETFMRMDPTRPRPAFWRLPIMEWLAVLSIIVWYLSTALALLWH
jgi:hypothetical membrane protein